MGWTNPITWTVGQLVTAALMNQQVRDNLLALGRVQPQGIWTTTPVRQPRLGFLLGMKETYWYR